jgi:hypothetical protein
MDESTCRILLHAYGLILLAHGRQGLGIPLEERQH